MSGEIPIDKWLQLQLRHLYVGMLRPGKKYLIHQKTFENGVMMIEWADQADHQLTTIFLHPNENYKDIK